MSKTVENFIRHYCDTVCHKPYELRQQPSKSEVEWYLKVDEEDIPRLIGKHGKTVEALRMLVRAIGMREETPQFLYIDEGNRSHKQPTKAISKPTNENSKGSGKDDFESLQTFQDILQF